MNVNKIISAVIVAAVLAGAGVPAFGGNKNKRKKADYEATIDSLKMEIERLNEEIRVQDDLATGNIDGNEDERHEWEYDNETTDSLLNVWYLHQSIGNDSAGEYALDSVRLESNLPDSVYIRRLKDMNSFIVLPYNDIVRNYIILYSEKMPSKIGKIIGLCKVYMPLFDEIFNQYDLPEELKAMAVIESALNPTAVSRAGAKGMWQFMYGTAKNYNLTINSFVDERLDPVASAHAAAHYLSDAYEIFGDWSLAIASYNCGAGNVNRAIRRSGGKRAFWDIYPYLPRETRGYLPAFVGALYTMYYYKDHGIVPETPALPPVVDTFKINKMLHFKQVEDLVGIPVQDLRNLNPQYCHDIVPGNEREYLLRVPYDYVNKFIDVEDTLYTYKADEYFNPVNIKKIKDGGDGERIVHKVKSGETLSRIASKYRVSVAQIKRWNNLRSDNIRIGQRLTIYRGGKAPTSSSSSSSSASSSSSSSSSAASSGSGTTTTYTVKSGDSLYTIAKKYPGVSAQNIKDYNGLKSDKIHAGMVLKIPAR